MENNTINPNTLEEEMQNEPSRSNKNLLIWGIGILVLLAVVIGYAKYMKPASESSQTVAEGCKPGNVFNEITGEPCGDTEFVPCKEGELYNLNTGEPCSQE